MSSIAEASLDVVIKRKTNHKSGFGVELRDDGFYYISHVPDDCTNPCIGDRVLDINGTNYLEFGTEAKANALIETFRLEVVPNDSGDEDEPPPPVKKAPKKPVSKKAHPPPKKKAPPKKNKPTEEKKEEKKEIGPNDRFMIQVNKNSDFMGIKLTRYKYELYVTEIVEGGTFFNTALDVGDKLVSVNGRKSKFINTVQEALDLMRSREKITLNVVRPDPDTDAGYLWLMENL